MRLSVREIPADGMQKPPGELYTDSTGATPRNERKAYLARETFPTKR